MHRRSGLILAVAAVAMAMFICAPGARAEEGGDSSLAARELRPGAWAMMLQSRGNSFLGDFRSSGISLKRNLSAHAALRVGIDVALQGSSGDRVEQWQYSDTTRASQRTNYETDNHVGSGLLDLQFLYYPRPRSNPSPFLAIGPFLSISSSSYATGIANSRYGSVDSTANLDSVHRISAGGRAGLGLEWFVARRMSLLAKYELTLAYLPSTTDYQTADRDGSGNTFADRRLTHARAWSLTMESVGLALAVYF